MAIFVISPFAGPALGPLTGGYIEVSGVSWRWVFWVLSMFAGFCFLLTVFVIPETYAPVLLVRKAEAIRQKTGDERYTAALERQNTHWSVRLRTVLGRPFKIMFLEPLLLVLTLYMSVSPHRPHCPCTGPTADNIYMCSIYMGFSTSYLQLTLSSSSKDTD